MSIAITTTISTTKNPLANHSAPRVKRTLTDLPARRALTGTPLCAGLPKPARPKPSSAAPNCSSTLPKSSSDLPKCSSRAHLEPFADEPIFATLSRQTPYNFAPEKSPPDLSPSAPPPDPDTPYKGGPCCSTAHCPHQNIAQFPPPD